MIYRDKCRLNLHDRFDILVAAGLIIFGGLCFTFRRVTGFSINKCFNKPMALRQSIKWSRCGVIIKNYHQKKRINFSSDGPPINYPGSLWFWPHRSQTPMSTAFAEYTGQFYLNNRLQRVATLFDQA